MTTPFNASKLHSWMQANYQDTVADLAQRGLAMEFFDAWCGRPTSLRLSSDKAEFGFHLPVPASFQGLADMEPMMVSARVAAPGFQQAFDGYDSIYADIEPIKRPRLEMRGELEERSGWQLHALPLAQWRDTSARYRPWSAEKIADDLGDVMARWTVEQLEMQRVMSLDIAQAVQDTERSKYHSKSDVFELLPKSAAGFTYLLQLKAQLAEEDSSPVIVVIVHADDGSQDGFQTLFTDSAFIIRKQGRLFLDQGVIPFYKTLKPEELGMSNETAAMLIDLGQPVTAGMPCFQQISSESYDMDFTMDDQASSSGLSI